MSKQNDIEQLKEMIRRDGMSVAQANVQLVLNKRVHLCVGRIPADVRKALNGAVATGQLKHIKKDGHNPEAYFHPSFEYLARGERANAADRVASALRAFAGFPVDSEAQS